MARTLGAIAASHTGVEGVSLTVSVQKKSEHINRKYGYCVSRHEVAKQVHTPILQPIMSKSTTAVSAWVSIVGPDGDYLSISKQELNVFLILVHKGRE